MRFRKTITLPNGARLNLSKSGVSVSVGKRGHTLTYGPNGLYQNISIPGTGLSERKKIANATNPSDELTVLELPEEDNGGTSMNRYKIYTDGGFCNTQSKGVGSWAFILLKYDEEKKEYIEVKKSSGRTCDTTNNKMEMQAVLEAFRFLKDENVDKEKDEFEVISDSMYVIKGSTEWVNKWKENEWKTLTNKDVKNQDLWMEIIKIKDTYSNLTFSWVKGHDNDKFNIECDALCQTEIREGVKEIQDKTKI
ncbi:MAG: DUF4236 domain-containing protein [Anaeroplasmataceae bacterium]